MSTEIKVNQKSTFVENFQQSKVRAAFFLRLKMGVYSNILIGYGLKIFNGRSRDWIDKISQYLITPEIVDDDYLYGQTGWILFRDYQESRHIALVHTGTTYFAGEKNVNGGFAITFEPPKVSEQIQKEANEMFDLLRAELPELEPPYCLAYYFVN